MFTNEKKLLKAVFWVFLLTTFQGIDGRSSYDLAPVSRHIKDTERGVAPSAAITGSQQTTASVSGFVNSTAEGNGQPNSAVASAWQGGQTSAQGVQTATADNSNVTAETTGLSTCLQGYQGTAGNANSTSATSTGNALCNATYNQEGEHLVDKGEKFIPQLPGKGKRPQIGQLLGQGQGARPTLSLVGQGKPHAVLMENIASQIGEAQSGQTHSSMSQAGGPLGGNLNILAGGFANMPQSQMTFQTSSLDSKGKPIFADSGLFTGPAMESEEHTLIGVTGGQVGHNSGGLSHVFGLGNNFNMSYNSHAPEEEGEGKGKGSGGGRFTRSH